MHYTARRRTDLVIRSIVLWLSRMQDLNDSAMQKSQTYGVDASS